MTTPRVTVPVEPTPEMIEAGNRALSPWIAPAMHAAEAYRAMLSAAPAPEGGAVSKACADFQEAIDDFEAEVADVMAEGSERADLWDREIMVNIDALKAVMNAALTPREEAPADPCAGHKAEGISLDPCCPTCEAPAEAGEVDRAIKQMRGQLVGSATFTQLMFGREDVRLVLDTLSALRAQPPARDSRICKICDGGPGNEGVCLCGEKVWEQPPAREDTQPVAKPAPFNPGGIGHAMYQAFNVYLADYVLSTDGADYEPTPFERDLIEDFFAGLMAEEAFFGPVRALYDTHPAPDALREAVEDIAAERQRQVDVEGWSAERDDEYTDRSLAHAAAAYALGFDLETRAEVITDDVSGGRGDTPVWKNRQIQVPASWPSSWDAEWWKPSDTRRDLVKAGALIVAEIERLDRKALAALQAEQKGGA